MARSSLGHTARGRGFRDLLRRLPARAPSGDSEFRIRDSRFPDHSPSGSESRNPAIPDSRIFPFGNPDRESGIALRPKAALGSIKANEIGSLRREIVVET